MKREEIFQYVKEQYGTEPEYLWKKDPDSAVLRHKNGKWYAIIMVVEKKILGLEEDGKITFLHKVKAGAVDKSYGIHVAGLAGLPKSLIKRSEEILKVYEKQDKKEQHFTQTSLFDDINNDKAATTDPIVEKIKKANPLEMTPMDAINFLYTLKQEMKEK